MPKVYGTGAYDFKRHRVAEYPVESNQVDDKPLESKPGSALPSTITLSEIQRDRLTKIADANWSKVRVSSEPEKPFDPELVKEIYETELSVKGGRKTVPLQRVMILEVSQYLENYLWPNFDPETATFEHVMSMILMVNEKFRENVQAWVCFYDQKDVFKGFLERVLRLKEGRELSIAEKTNYLVFMINAFQMEGSFAEELYSESLQSTKSVSSYKLASDYKKNRSSGSDLDNLKEDSGPLWGGSDDELEDTSDLDREWQKRHDQFHTIGYRDGVIAGKEASAQEGFNIGFKQSTFAGYDWGLVRGVSSVLACLPNDLKEKLVRSEENRNKFQSLYESVHSLSTTDALSLFNDDFIAGSTAEECAKVDALTQVIGLSKQNFDCGRLGKYYGELQALLPESPSLNIHLREDQ